MPQAKKLPSGKWRVRVFAGYDSEGKQMRESFTANTKVEAEMLASAFLNDRDRIRTEDLTVEEAVNEFIELHENVLSPSTVGGYLTCLKRMKPIYKLRIRKITSADIQRFISHLVNEGYSPKTVKSTYGLLHKVLIFYDPRAIFVVKLPKQAKKRGYAPSNEDIVKLFTSASRKLQLAIVLAACHSFRRGEISALKFSDIEGNRLHVHADLVQDKDNKWIYKPYPKTDDSDRYAKLPPKVIEFLGEGEPDDYIVGWMPGTISKRFYELRKELGISSDIRFHDLRHYFASIAAILGIPDIYTAGFGGWNPDGTVMKEVYQNKIATMEDYYADKMNDFFENLLFEKVDTEVDTENKKAAK